MCLDCKASNSGLVHLVLNSLNFLLHINVSKQIGKLLRDKEMNPIKAIRSYIFTLEVGDTKLPLHV